VRLPQLRISSVKGALSVGILLATLLVTVSLAFAALGGPASSVQGDQAHMQGTLRTTANPGLHYPRNPRRHGNDCA
jgi:hypothetical protein